MLARVRRVLHILMAAVFYYSGALELLRAFRRRALHQNATYVLGFHRILSETEMQRSDSSPGMIVSERTFVELVEYLKRRMQFVTLETLLDQGGGSDSRHKPRCLVTFDDAWIDTGAKAAPLLKQRETPAVVFVPAGLVGRQDGFWNEQLAAAWKDPSARERLTVQKGMPSNGKAESVGLEAAVEWLKHMPAQERQFILERVLPCDCPDGKGNVDAIMTWEQLARIQDQGIEVGGHTETHPLLTYEDDETVDRELRGSKEILEGKLGISVRAFAYPNGDWNQRVREHVKKAGYSCAFTTEPRCYEPNDDRFAIPRFLLHDGNVTGLRGKFSPAMLNLTLAGWV